MADLSVIIIGAGLGGLTLAQSLKRAGIPFSIFERDQNTGERPQGYRLHLDGDGICAAHEVLPDNLREIFKATSYEAQPFTTVLNSQLCAFKRMPIHDDLGEHIWPASGDLPEHINVDRATLRQILMSGLEDRIYFGKRFVRYESRTNSVAAQFDDGTSVEGTVLVGADGIRSLVRQQRAPHAVTVDSGIRAIYGRIPFERARDVVPAEALSDIFAIAISQKKVFLGLGAVCFPISPPTASRAHGGPDLRNQSDYVVCVIGGRREFFPKQMENSNSAELQRVAATMLADWCKTGAHAIRQGDQASFFLVDMYTSVPCALDAPSNVTVLGDAIHAMTPTLGRGANLAMRDGALLGRSLSGVARGDSMLSEALAGYEATMLRYGFDVVREAAALGQERMAQNPLPA